jgi:hypothetical protein
MRYITSSYSSSAVKLLFAKEELEDGKGFDPSRGLGGIDDDEGECVCDCWDVTEIGVNECEGGELEAFGDTGV